MKTAILQSVVIFGFYFVGVFNGFVWGWAFADLWYRQGLKAAWTWLTHKLRKE